MSTHNCHMGGDCPQCPQEDPVQKAVQEAAARGEDPFLAGILAKSTGCGNDNPGYQHCGDKTCTDCETVELVGPSPEQKRLMNHEVRDRAYLALDFWTDKVANHSNLTQSLQERADKITVLLKDFYEEAFDAD